MLGRSPLLGEQSIGHACWDVGTLQSTHEGVKEALV